MMSEREFERLIEKYQEQEKAGYIDGALARVLEPYRVHNAVIMAAGLSSRFAPLSYEKPKALLQVKGEILIEREIRQLQAAGIQEIYLVVGYMKEKLFYLEDKFGVHIIVNEDYYRYNNPSTLMLVKQYLSNTYICSSDNYFSENPFERFVYRSYYAAVHTEGETDEYCLKCDEDGRITEVVIGGANAWYMMGHVYFDRAFSERFAEILQEEYQKPMVREALWEDLYCAHLAELPLYIRKYPSGMIHEFDSLDELRAFDEAYIKNTDSHVFEHICRVLSCTEDEIRDIVPVKFGMTNLSFRFSCRGKWYMYRHPGVGTEKYINRQSEAESMKIAQKLGLDDTFIYIDAQEGWKISRYIQNAQQLDYKDAGQVGQAMQALNKLHHSGAKTGYAFDIWQGIQQFQQYFAEHQHDGFADMQFWQQRMESLYRLLVEHDASVCLCHADSYDANFLFDEYGKLYLIDWEYSGMADPAVDLGTFITCGDYTWQDVPDLLQCYLGHEPAAAELFHYTGYLAVCSYYWFLWALYQEGHGKRIGRYMYIWYQNMKLYGRKAEELHEGELR